MTAWSGSAIVTTAAAVVLATTLAASGRADIADPVKRPRGAVEDCSRISGFGASLRAFTRPRNLVVGPLAVLRAGRMLEYAPNVGGDKLFVVVRGSHRVTLELSPRTRVDAGLGFVPPRDPFDWTLRNARRVVTFVACRRGEYPWTPPPDGWPVSGWVGFLLARSPRCIPLLVWVDDEPSPRRAVIRFGVPDCG